jgi:hypothetical protein
MPIIIGNSTESVAKKPDFLSNYSIFIGRPAVEGEALEDKDSTVGALGGRGDMVEVQSG